MILPIGHEEGGVRRLPWVSFVIMGLCVVVFLMTMSSGADDSETADEFDEALTYWMEHPYLELPDKMWDLLDEASGGSAELLVEASRGTIPPPNDPSLIAEEQATLEELFEQAFESLGNETVFKYGLVPSERSPLTFITHMFLHGGWLHLLGNLLIFYLAAPFIEDVWGRPIFASFYIVAGIFAALVYIVRTPDSTIPMIGASGAIAGVMGAFLVRYWHTRIKFFYIFAFFIRGTFDAPAWVMLPLWFAMQVFYASLTDSLGPAASGVAYWAHIGGFVFGVGVAFAFRHFGVEERFLNTAIEAKTTRQLVDNTVIEQALECESHGETDDAMRMLAAEIDAHPDNDEAVFAYWSVAAACGRAAYAAPPMIRLIAAELRTGKSDLAITHWTELTNHVPQPRAGADLLIRLAQALLRHDRPDEAAVALRRAMLDAGSGMTSAMALRIARVARELDPQVARGAARLILTRPDPDPAERSYAEELLKTLDGHPDAPGA